MRVQLIIIENRFCGERRCEIDEREHIRDGDRAVPHLLLPDEDLVPAHRRQPQELGLLLGDPVTELPQADQQRAPVLPSVLKARPGNIIKCEKFAVKFSYFVPPNEMKSLNLEK